MIRKATPEDIDQILVLGFEQFIIEQSHKCGLSYNLLPQMPLVECWLREEGGFFDVVEVDGAIVGFCLWQIITFFTDLAAPILHQTGLYIKPEFRSNGYGKQLVASGEAWADKNNIRLRSIGSAAVGSPDYLQKYYEKQGFTLYQALYLKNVEYEDMVKAEEKEEVL